jgi:hypothetical protein
MLSGRVRTFSLPGEFSAVSRAPALLLNKLSMGSRNIVPKPDYIFDLEQRQHVLEEEIVQALSHCSPDEKIKTARKSGSYPIPA